MVGVDGVARVLDFGVAQALGRVTTTQEGQVKGKLAYMAPEQLDGEVSQRTDIYAASVVLWEMLTGERLFVGAQGEVIAAIAKGRVRAPSEVVEGAPRALDVVVMRGLAAEPAARFETARDMADALRSAMTGSRPSEVGRWVETVAAEALAERSEQLARIELASSMEPRPSLSTANQGEAPSPPRGRSPSIATASMEFEATATALATAALLAPVAPPGAPARPSASGWRTAFLVASACVAILGLTIVRTITRAGSAAPAPTALAAPPTTPPTDAADAAAVVATVPESPPPTGSQQSHASPAATRPPTTVAGSRRRAPPPASSPPAANCNPPYREIMVGDNVRRVPKSECL
jgi:serine/threonine-protein kinase